MELLLSKMDEITTYCEENGIEYLGIFGSYARGDFKKESDIDLLVKVDGEKTLLDIVRIERELSEILGIKVDLLTEESISKYIIDYIKKELRTIYERR
jgi:hypothetical protein